MSIESMAIALHHSRARGTAKVVLLGIANHDGDGGAWPSVATLAHYANVSRQNVQKAVVQLEQLREIRRVIQAGGDYRFAEHERPNRYEFLLSCPPDCDRSRQHKTAHYQPATLEIDPASNARPRLDSEAPPASNARPKPSSNSTQDKTDKARRVSNARANVKRGDCGHVMVTDRHCAMGCLTKEIAS